MSPWMLQSADSWLEMQPSLLPRLVQRKPQAFVGLLIWNKEFSFNSLISGGGGGGGGEVRKYSRKSVLA